MNASSEKPNPERRSDAALLCLFIGFSLMGVAWLLGLGGALAAIAGSAGGGAGAAAGGLAAIILLPIVGLLGFLFAAAGALWLAIRVIADQREGHAKDRYSREVER